MTSPLRFLRAEAADFSQQLHELRSFAVVRDVEIDQRVADVLAAVRERGDAALLEFTARFDQWPLPTAKALRIPTSELSRALESLASADREALEVAADRIRSYHGHQRQSSWEFTDSLGNRLGQRLLPMARVGLYVPGGQAAYPSTVLMTAIPAQVAGVRELVMTVPTPRGERNALVFAAAALAGIEEVYGIGGAQAIAALAFGTETIRSVDKIVGPGGDYVAAAKRMVFGTVGIDMIAGPSEVVVIADRSMPVDWAIADIFSQAEHDAAAQSILITADEAYAQELLAALPAALARAQRHRIIEQSLQTRGAIIVVSSRHQAVEVSNLIAPEHLQLAVESPRELLPWIEHAGAVFLGHRSAEVLGDYVLGPSHVLPTFGTARFSSVLGVYDFQRRVSVLDVSEAGADALSRTAMRLATGEGLSAHAEAARLRADAFANARPLDPS